MSRNQLVDAYQNGLIGRRAFIRGLVGVGLSVSLATAMADNVRAADGSSTAADDIYDPGTVPTDPIQLPDTGVGATPSSSSHLTTTLTALGAGAAVVAGVLRRKSNPAPEQQD